VYEDILFLGKNDFLNTNFLENEENQSYRSCPPWHSPPPHPHPRHPNDILKYY
jgi:hypothetical protein